MTHNQAIKMDYVSAELKNAPMLASLLINQIEENKLNDSPYFYKLVDKLNHCCQLMLELGVDELLIMLQHIQQMLKQIRIIRLALVADKSTSSVAMAEIIKVQFIVIINLLMMVYEQELESKFFSEEKAKIEEILTEAKQKYNIDDMSDDFLDGLDIFEILLKHR